MKPTVLVISCEHGGAQIPAEYQSLFAKEKSASSLEPSDRGSRAIAEHISQQLRCNLVLTPVSRLIIDCNRSLNHKDCFSSYTKRLPKDEKDKIINNYYLPFRQKTERLIDKQVANGQQVLHLSIHTFSPEARGKVRNAAISLLYDPRRHGEKEVARIWHELLLAKNPTYRIRLNYPFRGNSNSFASELRHHYPETDYLGLELEVNQFFLEGDDLFTNMLETLSSSLKELSKLL